jgi:nucleoside-diphosphate-sugar epimerase
VTTYAVTGANGLVGGALRRRLGERREARGIALVRRPAGSEERLFTLGEDVSSTLFAGVDVLIHAAHDFSVKGHDARRINVDGSARLFEAAHAGGVKRLVFVSSVSAHASCVSEYGRNKLEAESVVHRLGGISVRGGLVWGGTSKGIFGSLGRISRLPIVPVFDGGHQALVLTHEDDLAEALIVAGASHDLPADPPVIAANPRVWEFGELLRALAARDGRRLRTLSVSSRVALLGMRAVERAGLPLPFRSDSLLGLINPDPKLDFRSTERLGVSFRPFAPQP